MSPSEFSRLASNPGVSVVLAARAKLGATAAEFAELVGVCSATVYAWEAGKRPGPSDWQLTMIWALTVSPRCGEIVRCLRANGLAAAFALGLEAALVKARSGAPLSADPAAQRPAQMPVMTTAEPAELLFR